MEKRSVERIDANDQSVPIDESTAAGRMRQAVTSAAAGSSASAEALDAAAKALVTELRLAKEPPEQVLLRIKEILAEAGLKPSHGPTDSSMLVGRHIALYRSVIESSIRHYFAASDGPEAAGA